MAKKREIALNRVFNFSVIIGIVFILISVELFSENDYKWALGFLAAGVIVIACAALFTPYCYSFDDEGISLCYVLLPKERYLWKDIRSIEVEDTGGSERFILDFLFTMVFAIEGECVGKRMFYMQGHVRKTLRTKRLFEKYWDGNITGYLFEGLKKRINKRNSKKLTYSTEEIVPMEREVRAETRELIKPYIAQAMQYDLDLKTRYVYITDDFDESNSRPNDNYTYTLLIEISHFNETDENRIVEIGVDLLHVRLGKTSFRGIKSKNIQKDIDESIPEVLDEIVKNGIDVYCGE